MEVTMTDIIDTDAEQELRNIQRDYANFLSDNTIEPAYSQKIQDMVDNNSYRLIVNVNDVRRRYPERCIGLLKNSFREIECFQAALKATVEHLNVEYSKRDQFFVGFEGRIHYYGISEAPVFKNPVLCTAKDENKNPLETEFGLSVYKDHQTFSMQELPETAPTGQLPRSVDVIADNDLADSCKPGDRVRVIGVYRCLPSKRDGVTQGTFRTILISNNIQLLSKDATPMYSEQDVEKIKEFLKNKKNIVKILSRSLAPSIYGHDEVKRAILCMMLGGNEKILPNGSRLRGDINILLIGDPSVAKSQLLRYVCHTAHRAIATTGRGSSGVGLTAAVTTDQETGERCLEAGAMVLGDRGIVCIDEFDKNSSDFLINFSNFFGEKFEENFPLMTYQLLKSWSIDDVTDIDRTAIHEVMEQGRVSISKAGIHAKLNARCSVLAAANPVYGRYDDSKTPMENIAMQDSLLSRFDLLFVMLDEHNPERDANVAEHIIKLHKFRPAGEAEGAILPLDGASVQTLTTHDLVKDDGDAENYDIYETDTQWLPHRNSNIESKKIIKNSNRCPETIEMCIVTREKPAERKDNEEKEAKKRKKRRSGGADENDEEDDEEMEVDDETESSAPPTSKKSKSASDDPFSFSDRDDHSDVITQFTSIQQQKKESQVPFIDVQRYQHCLS
uniref:DNA replication licensing factor MCM3 n=1 Tax=Romanomermis culicivorax TaxID=13658 RepID=A0A915IUI8_ROMCU